MTRLTSRFLVDLLLRKAQAEGGFAMLLHKGDEHGGGILIQCRYRHENGPFMERRWSINGDALWDVTGPSAESSDEERQIYVEKRLKSDPDLWILELDIANAAQFIAEWGEIS